MKSPWRGKRAAESKELLESSKFYFFVGMRRLYITNFELSICRYVVVREKKVVMIESDHLIRKNGFCKSVQRSKTAVRSTHNA